MKKCPFCNAELEDNVRFCRNCGTAQPGPDYMNASAYELTPPPVQAAPQEPEANPYDHTAEFEQGDIAQNRLYAMLVYLLGLVGILIAMLGARDSAYASFHVRQGLKLTVLDALLAIAAALLCWTVIVPIAAGVCLVILVAVRLIGFADVCQSKAVEVPIVRSFGFLK